MIELRKSVGKGVIEGVLDAVGVTRTDPLTVGDVEAVIESEGDIAGVLEPVAVDATEGLGEGVFDGYTCN